VSRLLNARARLADALTGSGVSVTFGGRFAAPAVLVEPGEPWVSRERSSRPLESRWKVTAIAGRSDTAGAYDELGDMIDAIDHALLSIRGVSLPSWGAPHDVTLGNVAHPASTASVLIYTEEE
jgi:hypothetical protein